MTALEEKSETGAKTQRNKIGGGVSASSKAWHGFIVTTFSQQRVSFGAVRLSASLSPYVMS